MSELAANRLVHHVRAEHAATGRGVAPITAVFEETPPPGWFLRVKGADVVVAVSDWARVPAAPPVLVLTVADPVLALRIQQPSARVTLDQRELVHSFAPAQMTLTIELVGDDGTPSTGKTVRARGAAGAPVGLAEVGGEPGIYRSPERVWTASFNPLDVVVDGTPVRKLAIDFTRKDTRVRVVDTT